MPDAPVFVFLHAMEGQTKNAARVRLIFSMSACGFRASTRIRIIFLRVLNRICGSQSGTKL